ncbi:hypothetical protein M2155_008004 [Streptomyces sp. SAI-119]|uniref:HEPN-associated N-terminal domain-containing protein n=1 Tax=Streptomyces sp. SAI-119 TaxID=2940541 RepID=UPI002475A4B9|nr:HEPN-associated N-terminal domain-containing protein [Streptomyces sp. SAI-119]MDH6455505.1 hypothetical protein [Streptomyces sp. SAI-119]
MGGDWQIAEWERGWSSSDGWVCADCVGDEHLAAAVRSAQQPDVGCDFCRADTAAPFDVLMETFVTQIRTEYATVDDEGVWYTKEDGYVTLGAPPLEADDLVGMFEQELGGVPVLEAVLDKMHDRRWVPRDFALLRRNEALTIGWQGFCTYVRTSGRYFLPDDDEDDAHPDHITPAASLRHIAHLARQLLSTELPAGTRWWRAQQNPDQATGWGAARLGTAPHAMAPDNRMSAAGIAMFYGAADLETARQEVAAHSDTKWITVAAFEMSRPCTVIDFTKLPAVPSIFDPRPFRMRREIMFLKDFVEDLIAPVNLRDDALGYVPTQFLTEYLLRELRAEGLLYPSAQTRRPAAVLKVPNERCVDAAPLPGAPEAARLHLMLAPDTQQTLPAR